MVIINKIRFSFLRRLETDNWIKVLLDEAENERMHLHAFMKVNISAVPDGILSNIPFRSQIWLLLNELSSSALRVHSLLPTLSSTYCSPRLRTDSLAISKVHITIGSA